MPVAAVVSIKRPTSNKVDSIPGDVGGRILVSPSLKRGVKTTEVVNWPCWLTTRATTGLCACNNGLAASCFEGLTKVAERKVNPCSTLDHLAGRVVKIQDVLGVRSVGFILERDLFVLVLST